MRQLKLAISPVKGALLQSLQFEGETWSNFLHVDTLALVIKDVPMTTEEDEIALVVKSDDLAAVELRDRREERNEHAADSVTEASGEVVEDEFRGVARGASAHAQIPAGSEGRQTEVGGGAFRQFHDNQRFQQFQVVADDEHVREAPGKCLSDHVFDRVSNRSRHVLRVGQDVSELGGELFGNFGRVAASCDQDFRRFCPGEEGGELVHRVSNSDFLVVRFDGRF